EPRALSKLCNTNNLDPCRGSQSGLVQKEPLSGHSTDPQRTCPIRPDGEGGQPLISGERRVPQQLQPVRLGPTRQQFRSAFSHTLGVLTPQETTVVEEELQQCQVI